MNFFSWLWRVVKKGVWVLGFIPQLLDYLTTYIPTNSVPDNLRNILAQGASWQITLYISVAGFLISAYLVHKETEELLIQFQQKIRQLEDTRPVIRVGFQDNVDNLVETLVFELASLPSKPDFDALVRKRHDELLAQKHSTGLSAAILGRDLNMDYEKEVDQYLVEYKDFLIKKYEYGIKRAYPIHLVIENRGNIPANDITVELEMPASYQEALEHQYFEDPEFSQEELDYLVFGKPKEPKPHYDMFSQLQPTIAFTSPNLPSSDFKAQSNIDGPYYNSRNRRHSISYKIKRLIQHRSEKEFEPFWIWLGDITASCNWFVPIKITCAEFSTPKEQMVQIEIRVKSNFV